MPANHPQADVTIRCVDLHPTSGPDPTTFDVSWIQATSGPDHVLCMSKVSTHTHTHSFNGPFSGTTRVSRYQKGENQSGFYWSMRQWHQLGCIQACTTLQTDNHTSTPPLVFTGRMPFLPSNQQCQSTEGTSKVSNQIKINTSDDFRDWIT